MGRRRSSHACSDWSDVSDSCASLARVRKIVPLIAHRQLNHPPVTLLGHATRQDHEELGHFATAAGSLRLGAQGSCGAHL
jgi:hypothetical protein